MAIDILLDERTRAEVSSGCVVIDGLLTGWMSRGFIALKIYLTTSYRLRIARIASRDGVSYAKAEKSTVLRESIEKRRFKSLYGIDIDDLSIYDLVLNTGLMPIEHNIEIIKSFIEVY
jgi:predicted cytidylate kinase